MPNKAFQTSFIKRLGTAFISVLYSLNTKKSSNKQHRKYNNIQYILHSRLHNDIVGVKVAII